MTKYLPYRHKDIILDPSTQVKVDRGCMSNFGPEEEGKDWGLKLMTNLISKNCN